jgi:ABC-2 type transport system ATP-binding protein
MSIPGIIEAHGISKKFSTVTAVRDVSFTVTEGELFGFLGPNGAGKTTTINMLTGLARADTGRIRIAGIECSRNPKAAQHLMGVVPDESNLYPELSGFENLCFCGALYGMAKNQRRTRARQLLKEFNLTEAGDRAFAGYSKGMKRKLTIAAGIIHSPRILFLDEPTSGIDLASARQIRRLIGELNAAGTTIFLTTHYIEEAERLCRRIAFIVSGTIVRTDTLENLMRDIQDKHVVHLEVSGDTDSLKEKLSRTFPALTCSTGTDGTIRVESMEPVRVGPIVRFLEEQNSEIYEARKIRPSLEDVFVDITGIEARMMRQDTEKKAGRSA